MNEREKRKVELIKLYFNKYETIILSRKQAAKVLNISESTLDRLKTNGNGPSFRKDDSSKNGNVTYMLDAVIDFILDCEYITTKW